MSILDYCKKVLFIYFVISSAALWAAGTSKASVSQQERENLRTFLKDTISTDNSFEDKFDAEVWLFVQSKQLKRYIKNQDEGLALLKSIHQAARKAGLNPDLVLALIQIESAFNRYAISRVGAQGLMQVMPFWKNEIGRPEDNLTDIETNLSYGCRILQYYIKREEGKGGLPMALARYNGSYPRRIYTDKVLKAYNKRWNTGYEANLK